MNIVVAGDFHLDAQTDGKVKGGIPIRVLDTYKSLEQISDYCRDNDVTHLLLSGDFYLHNRPPQIYKAMFHKFVKSITRQGIICVIVEGNHDKTKSQIGQSAVSEFGTLEIEGVYLVQDYELLDFDDFQVACIAWRYDDYLPEFNLDKTKNLICVAHCTTWKEDQKPQWETILGRDFEIPIDYFMQFDYTVLGHIHKYIVLSENPLVMYPGSGERHTWGERGTMGFVHITDEGWTHIPYNLRPRYDLHEIPDQIDPEGMYKLTIPEGIKSSAELQTMFKDAFSFQLKEIRSITDRDVRILEDMSEMSPTDQLKRYFESVEEEFTEELEELWQTITM